MKHSKIRIIESNGIKKYLLNPSIGLLVCILFLSSFYLTENLALSFFVALFCSLFVDILLRVTLKHKIYGLVYFANTCALLFTCFLWLFLDNYFVTDFFYVIVYEVLFVSIVSIANLSRVYLYLLDNQIKNSSEKTFWGEFMETSILIQYGTLCHLLILLVYLHFVGGFSLLNSQNSFFYLLIPISIYFSIIIYSEVKMVNVVKLLRKEEWLPITNELGEITGCVAKSVSLKAKNKYLHPIIRVAVMHKKSLFLMRKNEELDNKCSFFYDHPFEKSILFNKDIDSTMKQTIVDELSVDNLSYKFLLKYKHETEYKKRLIFLFVIRLTDDQVDLLCHLKGKFWTMKQIEESFGQDGLFSETFYMEYEYLKNTVFQSDLN